MSQKSLNFRAKKCQQKSLIFHTKNVGKKVWIFAPKITFSLGLYHITTLTSTSKSEAQQQF